MHTGMHEADIHKQWAPSVSAPMYDLLALAFIFYCQGLLQHILLQHVFKRFLTNMILFLILNNILADIILTDLFWLETSHLVMILHFYCYFLMSSWHAFVLFFDIHMVFTLSLLSTTSTTAVHNFNNQSIAQMMSTIVLLRAAQSFSHFGLVPFLKLLIESQAELFLLCLSAKNTSWFLWKLEVHIQNVVSTIIVGYEGSRL